MTHQALDMVKSHYSDKSIVESYMKVGLWPAEDILIKRFFTEKGSILDIGCGAGRTSIALARRGFRVTAIDFIPEMIQAAKGQARTHNGELTFHVMDALHLDFPEQSFDCALFSFNGIEQVPGRKNREKVLRNIWKVLKPGGCFLLTCRSGLAVGRRSIAWMFISLQHLKNRLLSRTGDEYEFGDKVRNGEYHHYINPFSFRSFLRKLGYEVLYFNSESNVEREHDSSFFTNFSSDRALFYVLKKNDQLVNRLID